jgi:hypothetical protein
MFFAKKGYSGIDFILNFFSAADLGSGIRYLFDLRIRDPRWVKKSKSGSGMNIPDHISESSGKNFSGLKYFDADADPDPGSGNLFDPGSEMGKIRIGNRG